MKHENLNGRVAVVTGGGGVLCGDFSKVLAKQGVKVAVLDLNEAAAQKVVDEITADGGTAIAVGCNVLDPESMQKAREEIPPSCLTATHLPLQGRQSLRLALTRPTSILREARRREK